MDLGSGKGSLFQPGAKETPSEPTARPDQAPALSNRAGQFAVQFENSNTNEKMAARFMIDGDAVQVLDREVLNWLLRDWRSNTVKQMDLGVLETLGRVAKEAFQTGWRGHIRVSSGYRTKDTNDLLRRQGYGAARNSLHMQAKAIDLSIPGLEIPKLHAVAEAASRGGVGLYPSFVHVDSGQQRRWTG